MSIYHITKISYSKIGMTKAGEKRKVFYIPVIHINHDEKGSNKSTVYLDQMVPNKKYYKGWLEGKTFIGGITADFYDFFNEEGKRTGGIAFDKVGKVIQVNEDSIICLKGKTIYQVEPTGNISGSRDLTEEEMAQLGVTYGN